MGPLAAATILLIMAVGSLLLPQRLLRNRRHGVILAAAVIASALLVAWTLGGRDRPWVAELVPGSGVAIGGSWSLPMAALLIGCAWPALPRPWWRRSLLSAVCLALATYASLGFLMAATPHCDNLWQAGVCRQTTPSTCSPAAAATLLAPFGVKTSEGELAAACFTTARGTTLHGLVGGLRRYAPADTRVRVASVPITDLPTLPLPAILSVMLNREVDQREPRYSEQWGWIVDQPHSVVLESFDEAGHPLIADPANGRERWGPESLIDLWTGRVVWLERRR